MKISNLVLLIAAMVVAAPSSAALVVTGKLALDGRCFEVPEAKDGLSTAVQVECGHEQWPTPFEARVLAWGFHGSVKYAIKPKRDDDSYKVVIPAAKG